MTAVVCRWTSGSTEARAASDLLIRLMQLDTAYISHSEVRWGLSPDGRRWAEDASAQLGGYLAWVRSARNMQLAVVEADGALAGVAVVDWELDKPGRLATVMDVAVDPERRGTGLGAALLAFVEAEAKARGCRWLMLESGVRNTAAHAFFERAGLSVVSHTFAKPLEPGS